MLFIFWIIFFLLGDLLLGVMIFLLCCLVLFVFFKSFFVEVFIFEVFKKFFWFFKFGFICFIFFFNWLEVLVCFLLFNNDGDGVLFIVLCVCDFVVLIVWIWFFEEGFNFLEIWGSIGEVWELGWVELVEIGGFFVKKERFGEVLEEMEVLCCDCIWFYGI